MKRASISVVMQKIDAIKSVASFALTNIMDYQELTENLDKKECLIFQSDSAILIFIPYHDSYYDMRFFAKDNSSLKTAVEKFKAVYDSSYYVHVAVIGKESQVIYISDLLKECGFILGKKLARTQIKQTGVPKGIKAVASFHSSLSNKKSSLSKSVSSSASKELEYSTSFAAPGDEEEIFSLLLEEFDAADDSVPEIDTIREDIMKNNIIVLKYNSIIVCLHYFKIKNNVYYGIYDITKKLYRDKFLFFNIKNFFENYLKINNIIISRFIAWRDIENKRLMKYAALTNEFPDGVYIYNMNWQKEKRSSSSC